MDFQYLPQQPSTDLYGSLDDCGNGPPPGDFEQHFQHFDAFPHFDAAAVLAASPRPPPRYVVIAEADFGPEHANDMMRRSSSEEKQRAFRERKERHVKDLEVKLAALKQSVSKLTADNERLQGEVHRLTRKNKVLRASEPAAEEGGAAEAPASEVMGRMEYSPTDFYSTMLQSHAKQVVSYGIFVNELTGGRLLAPGATWDVLQEHPLFRKGLVDVGDVCDRLQKIAQ
ncbi:MAG: hypothetical protein M1829_005279 [Trizodia sp. TS-e1964]|nr:MAG: hypothetical protein M1829_005279 [Trizodia sp. TS-e1964]